MRKSLIKRRTRETDIELEFNLDGTGKYEISTGVGFFDHMMELFTRHGLFDIKLKVKGDTYIDCHHSVEDAGIVAPSLIRSSAITFCPIFCASDKAFSP